MLQFLLLVGGAAAGKCPAACGVCPPAGFTGACCHGNLTCETQNWTPETCTPAFGTWCGGKPGPKPGPTPGPSPPSPTPGGLPPPLPPNFERLRVNYAITLASITPDDGTTLGATHVILSFLEPATADIPAADDDAWIKYAVAEYANLTSTEMKALRNQLGRPGAPAVLLASLGGAAASHSTYSKYDPSAFGKRAAQYVLALGLDGLDVDLEGWGNDPAGRAFLANLTLAARAEFDRHPRAVSAPATRMVISHAPELPDFWKSNPYALLLTDPAVLDAIDFVNIQFYNQIPFPESDSIFIKDVYPPAADAPTCFASLVARIVSAASSSPSITSASVNQKLLLGFPCKDGSFPVGGANLNQCDDAQVALVRQGVGSIGYPLAGVFEWSAATLKPAELVDWNGAMATALGGRNASRS